MFFRDGRNGVRHTVGGCIASDIETDRYLRLPEVATLSSDKIASAYERGGALELLHGQQPQGIAHQNVDAAALCVL